MREIDKIDDRPWDIVAAFKDLHQRLVMLDFCQNNIIVDYEDVKPDFVVCDDNSSNFSGRQQIRPT